jgi:hypothetical protein
MLGLLIILGIWALCGLLAYGVVFAHLQGEYPDLAQRDRQRDKNFALSIAWSGPIGLIVSLCIVSLCSSGIKHGWRLR